MTKSIFFLNRKFSLLEVIKLYNYQIMNQRELIGTAQ